MTSSVSGPREAGDALFVFDVVTRLGTALQVSSTVLVLLLTGWFVVPLLARRRLR